MTTNSSATTHPPRYRFSDRRLWLLPVALWTVVVGASLSWNLEALKSQEEALAVNRGRFVFRIIEAARLWNARHGGLYAVADEVTPPNPYLKVPERDVTTLTGTDLTLVNPAYMTRQLAEVVEELSGVRIHITSLKPINPGNRADPWEHLALESFERGTLEAAEYQGRGAQTSFRYMAPLWTKKPCLRCHEDQGYELGDLRGGISVTFPSTHLMDTMVLQQRNMIAIHLAVWLLLSGLTLTALSRIRAHILALQEAKAGQERLVEQRTEELRREATELRKLSKAVEHSPASVVITDAAGSIEYVNRRFCEVTGYSAEEVLGKNPRLLKSGETPDAVYAELWATISAGEVWHGEFIDRRKSGELYWEETDIAPILDEGGRISHFVAVNEDITRRKQAAWALSRATRALKTLSGVNRALILAADEAQLLREVCQRVVGEGGYRFAWVGYLDHGEEKRVRPVSQAGYGADYLERIAVTWDEEESGRGPVGTAARTRQPCVIRNLREDPSFAPWRAAAEERGFHSMLGLPLLDEEGEVFGVLAIYAGDTPVHYHQPDPFDEEEVSLLAELAANLAYGITSLRGREQRAQAEEELAMEHRFLERVMETSPAGILVSNRDGRFVFANRRAEEVLRTPRQQLVGGSVAGEAWQATTLDGEPLGETALPFQRVVNGGRPLFGVELSIAVASVRVALSVNAAPVLDAEGNVERVVFTVEDISQRLELEAERERMLGENRQLTRQLFRVQEEERREIAHELHDELGQNLVAMKIEAQVLDHYYAAQGEGESREVATGLVELVDSTREVLRRVLQRLRPAMLEKLGLEGALKGMIGDWRRLQPQTQWLFTAEGSLEGLDSEVAHTVYRVVQEALTNSAKHAEARRVAVRLERGPLVAGAEGEEALTVTVTDDGRGLAGSADHGLGQLGMRERVASLGGKFQCEEGARQGVRITAIIPLANYNDKERDHGGTH